MYSSFFLEMIWCDDCSKTVHSAD